MSFSRGLPFLAFASVLFACGSSPTDSPHAATAPNASAASAVPKPTESAAASAVPELAASEMPLNEFVMPPEPIPKGRRLHVEVVSQATSLSGPEMVAPCDFERLYRGGIGKAATSPFMGGPTMSAMLKRSSSGVLSGTIHYDRVGAAMQIASGSAKADGSFEIVEKGGGTFVGTCDTSGQLSGDFSFQGKTQPFTWFPRPKAWPALFQLERTKKVKACEVMDTGIRFFGGSSAVNRAVNRVLDSGTFANNVSAVGRCKHVTQHESHSLMLFAGSDVITIQTGSSSDFGGAHPLHSVGGSGSTVDLRSGRAIALRDVVTSVPKLLEKMPDCLRDYLSYDEDESGDAMVTIDASEVVCDYPFDTYLWGCDKKEKDPQPTWALVEGGIAILAVGHVHAEVFRDGSGPIISWASLKRDKLLNPKSRVARLWKDVPPAAGDAPACESAHRGNRMFRWTVLSAK